MIFYKEFFYNRLFLLYMTQKNIFYTDEWQKIGGTWNYNKYLLVQVLGYIC